MMSFTNIDTPAYYAEDYDYSIYYQNELKKYQSSVYSSSALASKSKKPTTLPTINYFNERKCPIYVHHIKNDSSVYNNYAQKLISPRITVDSHKKAQNASKFVLDKLEETYWATWKPKKENETVSNLKVPRKGQNFIISEFKPVFQEHNRVSRKEFNRPHGDVNDDIIKYFKATRFSSGSTTDSISHEANQKKSNNLLPKKSEITKISGGTISREIATPFDFAENKKGKKLDRPSDSRKVKMAKQRSVSQEIQTEVHCPIILEEGDKSSEDIVANPGINEDKQDELSEKIENWYRRNEEVEKSVKPKGKGKKQLKEGRQSKKDTKKEGMPIIVEANDNSDSVATFVEHKDSIEITKKKQEKSDPKEHFPQPKCIRLYRKSGLSTGYIKGGTYPLKSCLKKDGYPKSNFKLGAPGSNLFVTTSSFSNRRRK